MKDRYHSNKIKNSVLGLFFSSCVLFLLPLCVEAFCFEEAGNTYGINPALLQSIALVESGLNPKAINKNKNGSSDLGLMQINSSWIEKKQLCKEELLSNPCYNVITGARILRECIDRWGYGWQAVGCYNAISKNHRVDYSWKIYHALKKEAARVRKIAKNEEDPQETKGKDRFLRFKVRYMEGTEDNSEP